MILLIENAHLCYEQILKNCKKGDEKILIFTGFDIDSICTIRILKTLLRHQNIKFIVIPVINHIQLIDKIEERKNSNDISTIIMINCGGKNDLTKFWFAKPETDNLCFLIDTHRPLHYNNIHSKNVIVIDDGYYNLENCPTEEGNYLIIILKQYLCNHYYTPKVYLRFPTFGASNNFYIFKLNYI